MHKQSDFKIMARMSLLVKPLFLYMLIAIILGVVGFLCAIFLPVLSALIVGHLAIQAVFPYEVFFGVIIVLSILRGVFHYGEQSCNHYIAFKLLAILRDKVFKVLRRLCPAKLEGKDRGNLVYLITSDIEALEVFYAHTISPIFIAIFTSLIMLILFLNMHSLFFMIALTAYLFMGIVIPIIITKRGKRMGEHAKKEFGELSSYSLETLRNIPDILQYGMGEKRLNEMHEKNKSLHSLQESLKKEEGKSLYLSNLVIVGFSTLMFLAGAYLYGQGSISFTTLILSTVCMLSSFGPVIAISNLSNHLLITMASARRVLELLDEQEIVKDIKGQESLEFKDIKVKGVNFAYHKEKILEDVNTTLKKGSITGIHGKSGSGKSTLLKLIMRFYSTDTGDISIGSRNLDSINTEDLRDIQSYVTQESMLFHDTIANNLKIAKQHATVKEVEEACKQANIHEFIMSLPKKYESEVSELGDSLSGGEKQRIALARAFLHDGECILLDEPTSNLDSLNEALILKSLKEQKDKTILLVSHRLSTLKIAHQVLNVENGKIV